MQPNSYFNECKSAITHAQAEIGGIKQDDQAVL